jgi:hypothetical protein
MTRVSAGPFYPNRRTVLKALGAGALLGGATGTASAQERSFELAALERVCVEPGDRVTFEMSLTQLAPTPDPDGPVTDIVAGVGFQTCPSIAAGRPDCRSPSWTEYEIVEHAEEGGTWSGSAVDGEWVWNSPDGITQGETRSFSVTIELSDDVAPGTYETFVDAWSFAFGPAVFALPQLDERETVSVVVP